MHHALPATETLAIPLGPASADPPQQRLPTGGVRVRLGCPSPAEDFLDDWLDLNQLLVRNPPATYLYRAAGNSMILRGILDGDILVVDRSVEPLDGHTVVATWDGNAPACKVLRIEADHVELHSANPHHAAIVLPAGTEVEVFVVVGVARQTTRTGRLRG